MSLLFTFNSSLPTLNEVIAKAKSHHARYSTEKKAYTNAIAMLCRSTGIKLQGRVRLKFVWHLKSKRSDPDNICFAKKYLLDGMVVGGMLENDGAGQIEGFEDVFIYGNIDKVEIFNITHTT